MYCDKITLAIPFGMVILSFPSGVSIIFLIKTTSLGSYNVLLACLCSMDKTLLCPMFSSEIGGLFLFLLLFFSFFVTEQLDVLHNRLSIYTKLNTTLKTKISYVRMCEKIYVFLYE